MFIHDVFSKLGMYAYQKLTMRGKRDIQWIQWYNKGENVEWGKRRQRN